MEEISLESGQFVVPEPRERVIYRGEILWGDGTHNCDELYERQERGIVLMGNLIMVSHPVFDSVFGDGEHTVEELIAMREKRLCEYLDKLLGEYLNKLLGRV